MMKTSFRIMLLSALAFISCESDDASEPLTITQEVVKEVEKEVIKEVEVEKEVIKEIEITPDTKFTGGFFVSAEGNFGAKDGSLAYVANDFSTTTNFIYEKVNGVKFAGLIQSLTVSDENIYTIVNDANLIVIVDKVTLKKKAVITSGLGNPRYMAIIGNKGYITNWGDGADTTDDYLAVLDLTTNTLEATTIPLANGVEQIVAKDNKLYVSHKGAFSTGNIISVVDTAASNAVITITVDDKPDELFFTNAGELVVLSEGKPLAFGPAPDFAVTDRTQSSISFINIADNTVAKKLDFAATEGASLMYYSENKIYYYSGSKVFEISSDATSLATATSGIEVGSIYGMNIKENNLYTVSSSFTAFSTLNVIDIASKSTSFSSSVGLGAAKIYFN